MGTVVRLPGVTMTVGAFDDIPTDTEPMVVELPTEISTALQALLEAGTAWTCKGCGVPLFIASPDGLMCANCGEWISFESIP